MSSKNQDWLVYQKLVAEICGDLGSDAIVTHDDKIPGRITGRTRQIDVSIRSKVSGFDILIIVQVKDYERPADINVIGEFKSVVDDVGANKGIVVCSKGFTKPAKQYARRLGIDICTATDAESKKWQFALTIPLIWIENPMESKVKFRLFFDQTNSEDIIFSRNVLEWPVSSDGGVTRSTLEQEFIQRWNSNLISREVGVWHITSLDFEDSRILLGEKDFWCRYECSIEYFPMRECWLGQFTLPRLKAIIDYNNNTIRGKARIARGDLPQARSAKWVKIDNLDEFLASHPLTLQLDHELLQKGQLEILSGKMTLHQAP